MAKCIWARRLNISLQVIQYIYTGFLFCNKPVQSEYIQSELFDMCYREFRNTEKEKKTVHVVVKQMPPK